MEAQGPDLKESLTTVWQVRLTSEPGEALRGQDWTLSSSAHALFPSLPVAQEGRSQVPLTPFSQPAPHFWTPGDPFGLCGGGWAT